MLDQWKTVWNNLSLRHRVTIGVAVLLVAAAFFGLTRWQRERTSSRSIPACPRKMPEQLSRNSRKPASSSEFRTMARRLLAPSARQAELRLELASAGLPIRAA